MKKTIAYSVILLLFISALGVVSGGCSKSPDEQLHDLYTQSLNQIDKFQYDEAQVTIAKMGDIMTSSPWIPLARGIAFEQRLEYWDALHQYRVAHDAATDFAPAYDRSARLFARLGLWDDAIQDAFEATKHRADDPEAWILAAQCVIGGRLFDRTHQTLANAEKNGAAKDVTGFIAAKSLFESGNWDSATALASSITISQETPSSFKAAADYFESAGQWDSSMALSRKAMELSNSDFDVVHDHFYRSLRTKHFGDARQIIQRYKEIGADSILVTGLKMIAYEARGYRMAGAQFSGLYREIVSYDDISPTYWDMKMRQYQGNEIIGDEDAAAVDHLMKRAKWLPEFQEYMHDLVTLEVPASMLAKTVNDRLESAKIPWTQRRRYKVAQVRLRDRWGQFKELDSSYVYLKQTHGTDPEWMSSIADLYNAGSVTECDSARAWYYKALKSQRWRPSTFLSSLAMYERMEKFHFAVEACDSFPQYEQLSPSIAVKRAIDEVRMGKFDEGISRFVANFPHISGAVVYADTLLKALRSAGEEKRNQPILDLLGSTRLEKDVDALGLLADQAWEVGDAKTSLELCERAEVIEPDNPFLLAKKARAMYGVGKTEDSYLLFEKILAEQPRTVNAYVYYSQVLANDPTKYDKAANWARGACAETDAALAEVLNLCEIYHKVGRYDLMLGEAGKLLNMHPRDPEAPYWVGLGLYLNHRDSVKMFLDRSIALGLKGEKLQKAKETLSRL